MNWINVEEQLPEKMLDVLFIVILDGCKKEMAIGHYCDNGWNSCFLYNSHALSNDKSIINVTHWQPLPEPPNGRIK